MSLPTTASPSATAPGRAAAAAAEEDPALGRHVHVGARLGRPTPARDDLYLPRRERSRRADALAWALARAGARTTVVTGNRGPTRHDPRVRTLRVPTGRRGGLAWSGVATHVLPIGRGGTLHLHLDGLDDLLALSAAGRTHRGRLVLHVHGSPSSPLRSGETARLAHRLLGGPLEGQLARRAELVVVGSDRLAELASAAGARHVAVLPPAPLVAPLELPDLATAEDTGGRVPGEDAGGGARVVTRGADDRPAGRRRIVSVGPLTAPRRPSLLVEALADLPREVTLTLIGTGPQRAAVEATAHRLGVRDRVEVRPQVTWAALGATLAEADVLTSAALVGEDPGPLLLAAAAGRPIVATASEGLGHLLTDEVDGWLVPPSRVDRLACALRHALADPELAASRGASAARRVAARDWDAVASELVRVLDGSRPDTRGSGQRRPTGG